MGVSALLAPGSGRYPRAGTAATGGRGCGDGAGERDRASGAGHREGVPGRRSGDDHRVAGCGRRRRNRQPFVAAGRRTREGGLDRLQDRDRVAVHVAAVSFAGTGLHRDLGGVGGLLRLGVVGLALLVEERRQRDRGEDAKDEHDDEQLDQREAGLAVTVEAGSDLCP